MSMVLNRMISVSGGALKTTHKINAIVDFTNIEQAQIMEWAMNDRIISLQRTLRNSNDEFITNLGGEIKISAAECGGKIVTPAERIQQLITAGMPEKLARLAVTDPNGFAKIMAGVK